MKSEPGRTFESRYPRAFSRLRIAYFVVVGLLILEIGARVSTYLMFRSGLASFPEIQRRYEQSHVFYPAMTVGVVTGDPEQFPGAIPSEDGPPRIEPFGSIPEDAFLNPLPTAPPSPGVVRIAFVGGSTTYDGYPERVAERLHRRLGSEHVEIVNLGIPASNTGTSLVMMRRFLPQVRPHLVVVYHGFNDVVYWRARTEALARLERGDAGPDDPAIEVMPASRGLLSLLRPNSTAAQLPLAQASLDAIADNYEAMATLATELDFSLWVSTFAAPTYAELDAEEQRYFEAELRYLWPVVGTVARYQDDLGQYRDTMRDVAERRQLGMIDVAAEVRGGRSIFADNCHLTEAGRELHADAVAASLAPAIEALLAAGSEP